MKIDLRYLSTPELVCFDNGAPADPPATPPATPAAKPTDSSADPDKLPSGKVFSTDEVEELVTKRLEKFKRSEANRAKELESQYQSLLENHNLTEEEKGKLRTSLADLQKEFRSKEEQAKHERKTLEEEFQKQLKDLEQRATKAEQKYVDSTIQRALQDAAVAGDAYLPSQIVALLRPSTKMVEKLDESGKGTGEFVPMVDLDDRETDTGKPIVTQHSPQDAIKRMKQLHEIYGNLFKTNVVAGIGGSSTADGLKPGANGRLSPEALRKLTPAQYAKMRKENPEMLGLGPRGF